jgi:hypothetical protein
MKTFEEIGDKFIRLGEAIKNPQTTLRDLADAAFYCGLDFQFRLAPMSKAKKEAGSTLP